MGDACSTWVEHARHDVDAPPASERHVPGDLAGIFRKLSRRLLPIFFLLNCLNYVDRANIAFASIQMKADLQFTSKEYGYGAGLFFVGYSLFQLPSQLLLRHVGAPIWLAIIVTVWGAIAISMAFITNVTGFYVTRLLLGIAESGSFPGYWYYLTLFYPDEYITLPYAVTDSAIMVAQVVGAPLAAALLHLDGALGLRGWQWLFLAEGAPTVALGLSMPFALPSRPVRASCLSEGEAAAVETEVAKCRGRHGAQEPVRTLLRDAFSNRRIYIAGAVKFTKDMTTYACMFWTPLLIRGLRQQHGVGSATALGGGCEVPGAASAPSSEAADARTTGYVDVLLTGIPYALAALGAVLCSWHSQRVRERRQHIGGCYCAAGVVLALLPLFSAAGFVPGFLALTAVIVLALAPNGALIAFASACAHGPSQALTLAVFNSIGNMSGVVGPVLLGLVKHATCSYAPGFVVLGLVLVAGGILAFVYADESAAAPGAPLGSVNGYLELAKADQGAGDGPGDGGGDDAVLELIGEQ